MVVHCKIEFDQNSNGTYYAGQMVSGKIILQSDKVKQMKGIILNVMGVADTAWSETTTNTTITNGVSKTETTTTKYTGHEDYISIKKYILRSNANELLNIEPGVHTYSFSYRLPTSCPSSFEGSYGHIRYIMRVVLSRPWKFPQTYFKAFTVLKVKNLNLESHILNNPTSSEIYKTFCCGPCRSEPLKIKVSIPQKGFVPGQHIPVSVLINNDSRVEVENIKVSLLMLVSYYSQFPTTKSKSDSTTVTKMKGVGVLRHCNKLFNYDLQVPATPSTCNNHCRLIHITYKVQVIAKLKSSIATQVVYIPVNIGNVPLKRIIEVQPAHGGGNQIENLRTDPDQVQSTELHIEKVDVNEEVQVLPMPASVISSSPGISNMDVNIVPPCYEEAVHMKRVQIKTDDEHEYGESEFAPRYPVFNIPSPEAVKSEQEAVDLKKSTCF